MIKGNLQFSQVFLDAYGNLPSVVRRKVDRQLAILSQNVTHPSLRIRKMTDMYGIWEGRVDRRYRFTF